MKRTNNAPGRAVLLALLLAPCLASAQPAPDAARCGPGASASGPDGRCARGGGMMSGPEGRGQRAKMHSFKTYEECRAFVDARHEQMRSRAQDQGRPVPERPRHDPCSGLKPAPK